MRSMCVFVCFCVCECVCACVRVCICVCAKKMVCVGSSKGAEKCITAYGEHIGKDAVIGTKNAWQFSNTHRSPLVPFKGSFQVCKDMQTQRSMHFFSGAKTKTQKCA